MIDHKYFTMRGLCYQCRKNPLAPGSEARCVECMEYARSYAQYLRDVKRGYKRKWQRKARRDKAFWEKEKREIQFAAKLKRAAQPRCFACERTSDLKPILRNVVVGNQLVEKTVLWCGC